MSKNDSFCYRTKNTNVVQMPSFFKFYILGTIQANYIHYKMINIFLCCNGRPLLGSHLNWWEVIQRQPGDCVIVDKQGVKVSYFLLFTDRLYTGDKLLSLRPDQPELIGAEEIIFHLSSLLSLWITSCGWKNYTDQFQFLPLRQQNCNLTDFCIFLPVFLFCDKEPRPTISTQVAASIC